VKKLVSLVFLTSWISACGNQPVSKAETPPAEGVGEISSRIFPLERPVRLRIPEFDMAGIESYRVQAYMKCCKTPVELSYRYRGDTIEVDVKEFWSPGVYVFEVIAFGAAGGAKVGRELTRQVFEVTAK
jgi:hypothetical protein